MQCECVDRTERANEKIECPAGSNEVSGVIKDGVYWSVNNYERFSTSSQHSISLFVICYVIL
jgi:hypothetical protein